MSVSPDPRLGLQRAPIKLHRRKGRAISRWKRRFLLALAVMGMLGACYAAAGPTGLLRSMASRIGLPIEVAELVGGMDPQTASASNDSLPVLFGLYTSDSLQVTGWEIENFDAWLRENGVNKRVSLAGTFMDIEYLNPDWNVHTELNAAWDRGYTPFVNLTAYQRKAAELVNDPVVEERLRKWAAAFARWSDGGKKRAFLAPLQEMNGGWVRYGTDPANFKLAWLKIQRVFKEEGVAENAVSWVFAPNGWAEPGHEFENYYPGDSVVDVIAFSTLNFGGCPEYGSNWDTFELVFEPYLDRLHAMAPGKPIFLAQTSTVGVDANGRQNDKLKNEWLRDTYAKLAAYPGVRAVIYYNLVKSEPSVIKCRPIDWRIFDKHGKIAYEGFLDAARSPRFDYWAPDSQEMVTTAFGGQPQAFYSDVWPAHPFSGSDDPWYFSWVDALQKSGVAIGCRTETALVMNTPHEFYYYCPESLVTRAEMAMFLELAMRGGEFRPPGAGGSFSDVPAEHWAVGWIEQLAADGITSGCVEGKFCPENPVTRAEMALFVGRAKHWPEAFEPLPASGGLFEDVPADRWGAAWVEQLAVEGITAGCKPRLFCPDDHVTRSQLALFLVRAFALTDR
ncbi:MAG TPA: S-layer homology domain-containing protein [Anaerolineales bacterium]|nr:S-layer homology domain-containing protein [Anaerolineales bacterium]